MGLNFSNKKWVQIYQEIDKNFDNQVIIKMVMTLLLIIIIIMMMIIIIIII